MQHESSGVIRILHVEDELPFAEMTATFLERELGNCEVSTETSPEDGLARLEGGDRFDCIISDYNMPKMNGIKFLESVRECWPDVPFILFTGRGSEEVASDAISAGVTDYLQKKTGPDQYTVLANRIQNAVKQYRAEREIEETRKWYRMILEHSSDYVMIVDEMGEVSYVSPAIERVLGYEPDDVIGTGSFNYAHPDDIEHAVTTLAELLEHPERETTVEFRSKHADGGWRWLEVRGRNLLDDPVIRGVMVNVRDISRRKKREQDLERETERLQNLTRYVSHDVRNQLSIIDGYLTLAAETYDDDGLLRASNSVDRIEQMIDKVEELAQGGRLTPEREPVDLPTVAEGCLHNTIGDGVELLVESEYTVSADEEQLRTLLENLFLNAVEHGDAGTIRIGELETERGFYVADDGCGVSPENFDLIFDPEYTTSESETGLGLAVVEDVAEMHGWSIDVLESAHGGVRFEFSVDGPRR